MQDSIVVCWLLFLLLLALHLSRLQWCVWVLQKCIFSGRTCPSPLLLSHAEKHAHIPSYHFAPWCPMITPALHACCHTNTQQPAR